MSDTGRRRGIAAAVTAAAAILLLANLGATDLWAPDEPRYAAVADEVRAGKDKALGACIGPVMKASGGKVDPKRVTEVLMALIEADS